MYYQIIITFVGVDQIIYKSGNKSTWMHAHQIRFFSQSVVAIPIILYTQF